MTKAEDSISLLLSKLSWLFGAGERVIRDGYSFHIGPFLISPPVPGEEGKDWSVDSRAEVVARKDGWLVMYYNDSLHKK